MSCITCGTLTDMVWWDRTAGDDATPLARRVPCLVARRGVQSQLDGDESAKDCRVASVENRIPRAYGVLLTAVAALVSVAYLWRCSRPKNQPRPQV
jgi:hypothetical protein